MPFLNFLGAGSILLGLSFIIVTIVVRRSGQGIANWPNTMGTVVKSEIYRHERRTQSATTITYTPTVTYTYTLEGQTYTANKRNIDPYTMASFQDAEQAQDVLALYPAGDAVKVYYNPAVPQQAVLEKPRPIMHNTLIWYGIMLILIGGGAIVLTFGVY
ncbi:MAG: DUF3592 domain-containing protein [Anaerolineae bacterium]|nr:DUF3592 domain-containing protein [Anaerolineae bacterium]